jgi:hypothetical protein
VVAYGRRRVRDHGFGDEAQLVDVVATGKQRRAIDELCDYAPG